MYQVLVLGPCQVAGPAPLVTAVTQYATCHPSLFIMMAVMALTTAWTIALLACQLYQVNMGVRLLLFCTKLSTYTIITYEGIKKVVQKY